MTLLVAGLAEETGAQTGGSVAGAAKPGVGQTSGSNLPEPSPEVKLAIAQFQRAESLRKAGKPDAVAAYKEFIRLARVAKMAPSAVLSGYQGIYQVADALHDGKAKESSLLEMGKISPDNAGIWLELANFYMETQRFADARANAEKTLKLKPKKDEFVAQSHFILGAAAFAAKDFKTAETEYRLSLKLAPSNSQVLFNLMLTLYSANRPKDALVVGQKLLQIAPRSVPGRMLFAQCSQEINDLSGALSSYEAVLRYEPKNRLALFNRAQLCQQLGRNDDAISAYLGYLELVPKEFVAHFNVAQLYMGLKNYLAARRHFAIAIQIRPKDVRSLNDLAFCERESAFLIPDSQQRNDLLKSAILHYKLAMELAPKDNSIRNQLGGLYFHAGRFNDALALFREDEERDPDNPDVYRNLTRVFVAQRQLEPALATWKKYRSRKPNDPTSYGEIADLYEATSLWKEASEERIQQIQRDPKNGQAKLSLAKEFLELKQPDRAEAEYKLVLDLDAEAKDVAEKERPYFVASRRTWRATAWRGLADLCQKRGDLDNAILYLDNIRNDNSRSAKLDGKPPDARVYLDIANLYETKKAFDLARKEYKVLTAARPDDPAGFAAWGEFEERQGNIEEAVAAFQRAEERSNDPVVYGLEEARVYQKHQKFDQALTVYLRLVKKYPHDPRCATPLGEILEQTHDDQRALAVYDALQRANPTDISLMDKKAIVLTRLKRYPEARALREKILASEISNYQLYANIGFLYQQEGKPEAYLNWIRKRVEADPHVVPAMAALVDAYVQQKREDAGWKIVETIVEKYPDDTGVQETFVTVLGQHRKIKEAIAVRERLVRRFPKDLELVGKLATLLSENGEKDRANRVLLDYIDHSSAPPAQRTVARRLLAMQLYNAGHYTEAIAQMRLIIAAEPDDLSTVFALGKLYVTARQDQDAIALYQERSRKANSPPLLRAHFLVMCGDIYAQRGEKRTAKEQYEAALKLDSQNEEAKTALARLESSSTLPKK